MSVYLGNLNTREMADRLEITMSEEDINKLESFRCDKADVEQGKWHCFDIPFMVACSDMEVVGKAAEILVKHANDMKGEIRIGVSQND